MPVESVAILVALLTPLFGVPLTVITFYLKSIREQHVAWRGECMRRMNAIESVAGRLERALTEFQRDFATKEEWLRESLQARADLRRLIEAVVRVETRLEQDGLALRGLDDPCSAEGSRGITRNTHATTKRSYGDGR